MPLFSLFTVRARSRRPGVLFLNLLLLLVLAPTALADPADFAGTAAPLARSRHLKQLGVGPWHEQGFRGKGVKVAILDSGFAGFRMQLGKALPAQVTVRSFRRDGNLEAKDSQHGILCGEVIHALAPDAELLFANWEPNHPEQFLAAVRWAVEQGAQVISCSLIMPTWSDGEGGGPIHAQMARLLGDGNRRKDVLFVACSGNTADRHWSGSFADNGSGLHLWIPGQTDNGIVPWGTGRVSVELCAEEELDVEICIRDATDEKDLPPSRLRSYGEHRCAVVHFQPDTGHAYQLRLRGIGPRTGRFHVFVLGGSLRHACPSSSIPFPGDGPEVVTIGAVDDQLSRMPYSSCGPNSRQPKPDLVAPVPFQSTCRSRPFAGTSAAAPQAAGVAALLLARHPDWTPNKVRAAMFGAALDLGPQGHDWETGHGLVRLPQVR